MRLIFEQHSRRKILHTI